MPTSPFVYTNLPHPQSIRLINLQPGAGDDSLLCTLIKTNISVEPEYEAISYAWGDEKSHINVLDDNSKGSVEIPKNLELALLRLRYEDQPRILWTDSICINQSDVEERSQQVKFMGDIYSKAIAVLIWLGDEDDETAAAFECIDKLEGAIREIPSGYKSVFTPDSTLTMALGKLLGRSVFRRAWTYQEAVLARTINGEKQAFIVCGSFIVPVHKMARLGFSAYLSPGDTFVEILKHSDHNLIKVEDRLRAREGNTDPYKSLLEAALRIRGTGCSDHRDLVYSILGIGPKPTLIDVDYNKPVETVFLDFARAFIRKTNKLVILEHAGTWIGANRTTPSRIPSWFPDWREDIPNPGAVSADVDTCYATGTSLVRLRRYQRREHLVLEGLKVDIVQDVHSPQTPFLWRYESEYLSKKTIKSTQDPCSHTQHHMLRAPRRSFSNFSQANDSKTIIYPYTGDELTKAFARATNFDDGEVLSRGEFFEMDDLISGNLDEPTLAGCIETLKELQNRRSLCFSQSRYIGLIPDNSRPGDLICLLLGGNVPFILRPDGDEYILIGDCFILGLMEGEGLVEARKRADSSYDGEDISWLDQLHQQDTMPFPTETFVIK